MAEAIAETGITKASQTKWEREGKKEEKIKENDDVVIGIGKTVEWNIITKMRSAKIEGTLTGTSELVLGATNLVAAGYIFKVTGTISGYAGSFVFESTSAETAKVETNKELPRELKVKSGKYIQFEAVKSSGVISIKGSSTWETNSQELNAAGSLEVQETVTFNGNGSTIRSAAKITIGTSVTLADNASTVWEVTATGGTTFNGGIHTFAGSVRLVGGIIENANTFAKLQINAPLVAGAKVEGTGSAFLAAEKKAIAGRVETSGAGTITKLGFFLSEVTGATDIRIAVLKDSTEKVGEVLQEVAKGSAPTVGENVVTLSPPVSIAATEKLWIAFEPVGGSVKFKNGAAGTLWTESSGTATKISEQTWIATKTTGPIGVFAFGALTTGVKCKEGETQTVAAKGLTTNGTEAEPARLESSKAGTTATLETSGETTGFLKLKDITTPTGVWYLPHGSEEGGNVHTVGSTIKFTAEVEAKAVKFTDKVLFAGTAAGTQVQLVAATGKTTFRGTAVGAQTQSVQATGRVKFAGSASAAQTVLVAAKGAVRFAGRVTVRAVTKGAKKVLLLIIDE